MKNKKTPAGHCGSFFILFLLEQMPNRRECAEQTNHEQADCNGGDAGEVGILVLPNVMQDYP